MIAPPTLRMNDGVMIPQVGLGVMSVSSEDMPALIADAVTLGYRHFDTATHYGNEAGVGDALRRLEFPRDDIIVATKLPNACHGYDEALRAFDRSEQAIGRIDLYLIHWPQPPKGRYRDCWRALVRLQQEGRVRSAGVCNFTPSLLDEIIGETGVTPVLNQVELHPAYQQHALRAEHARRGMLTESWSPLDHGRAVKNEAIITMADRIGCTAAQLILAWHLQNGLVVIPKAADRRHLAENFAASQVQLSEAYMVAIAALDRPDGSINLDPMIHTSEQGA